MKKATARAHPNIALVKYWGKRDQALFLPQNPSLSMTLSGLTATTTVAFSDEAPCDRVQLDGQVLPEAEIGRFTQLLDLVRTRAGMSWRARVVSETNFPKAAGLASSAAGGAALTAAACWAAGLDPSAADLSRLARRYSGSACRSVEGGFCEWLEGERPDGADSFAVQVAPEAHWPELRMVVTICSEVAKDFSSRDAMRHTVETSPYFAAWAQSARADVASVRAALLARDLKSLGPIVETNACRMHASALAAHPPVLYMRAVTLDVIEAVKALRREGAEAWFTLDAGPNPIVLCLDTEVERVERRLGEVPGVLRTVAVGPGEGVQKLEDHLF